MPIQHPMVSAPMSQPRRQNCRVTEGVASRSNLVQLYRSGCFVDKMMIHHRVNTSRHQTGAQQNCSQIISQTSSAIPGRRGQVRCFLRTSHRAEQMRCLRVQADCEETALLIAKSLVLLARQVSHGSANLQDPSDCIGRQRQGRCGLGLCRSAAGTEALPEGEGSPVAKRRQGGGPHEGVREALSAAEATLADAQEKLADVESLPSAREPWHARVRAQRGPLA